jgi:hypothetical protein
VVGASYGDLAQATDPDEPRRAHAAWRCYCGPPSRTEGDAQAGEFPSMCEWHLSTRDIAQDLDDLLSRLCPSKRRRIDFLEGMDDIGIVQSDIGFA